MKCPPRPLRAGLPSAASLPGLALLSPSLGVASSSGLAVICSVPQSVCSPHSCRWLDFKTELWLLWGNHGWRPTVYWIMLLFLKCSFYLFLNPLCPEILYFYSLEVGSRSLWHFVSCSRPYIPWADCAPRGWPWPFALCSPSVTVATVATVATVSLVNTYNDENFKCFNLLECESWHTSTAQQYLINKLIWTAEKYNSANIEF